MDKGEGLPRAQAAAVVKFPGKAMLRTARNALPDVLGACLPIQSSEAAASACARIAATTNARITLGYFAQPDEEHAAVAQTFIEAARALSELQPINAELAVKAPPLGFDPALLESIAAEGIPLILDALTPGQAPQTLALSEALGSGIALPARWRRSVDDARILREKACRIRVIKGEWADPDDDPEDAAKAYLDVVRALAGRTAPVEVATHDPQLAEAALAILAASGTPAELGQLRGLPQRRSRAVALRHKVPVRYYYPYGPGWWPYAIEQALRKPYLPVWALRDTIAR